MLCIYVVEDDKNICEIETYALKNSGYQVEGFASASAFYEAMDKRLPDLILLDIMLPDEDGLSVVEKLKKRADFENIPIILVTAKTTELDRVKGLDMGADDYISKPFGVMELISRVKAVLRRTSEKKGKRSFLIGGILLDDEKHCVIVKNVPCELTFKEYELLKLLMQKEGTVTPRDMILEKVWGTDFEGESRTLDMHIKTLRRKLGEEGGRIKTVRGVGYIME